jgi:HlyD family secretion protein
MARASREVEAARQALDAARSDLGSSLSEAQRVDLGQAEDDLGEAAAAYEVAREVYDRASLARVTEDLLEAADEQLERARSALEDAQQAYDDLFADETAGEVLAARAGLALAQARYDAARDRLSRLESGDYALQVRAADIARRQAQAGVAQAEASVAQAASELAALEVQLARLVVRAPTTGVVLTHDLQAGEVIVAGGAVMTLGRLDDLTLTVYAPEDRYGQIRLGDRAVVTVDSFPGVEFTAMVTRIADQAEFTPRNVQTEEGRRTTVFAVELALDDSGGRLKPGMPADVRFEGTP